MTARVKKEEKIKSADAARERRKLKGIRSEVGDCEEAAYIERKKTGRRKITRKYDFSPRSLPAQRQIIIEIKRFDEQNIRGKKRIGREKIETYRKKRIAEKNIKARGNVQRRENSALSVFGYKKDALSTKEGSRFFSAPFRYFHRGSDILTIGQSAPKVSRFFYIVFSFHIYTAFSYFLFKSFLPKISFARLHHAEKFFRGDGERIMRIIDDGDPAGRNDRFQFNFYDFARFQRGQRQFLGHKAHAEVAADKRDDKICGIQFDLGMKFQPRVRVDALIKQIRRRRVAAAGNERVFAEVFEFVSAARQFVIAGVAHQYILKGFERHLF